VLVVDCPEEEQIARVMRRSALPREQVLAIMATQASRADRLACADDVIDNGAPGGTALSALDERVRELHARYATLAGSM
jgi:dephospho-CoA kinase